MGAPGKDGRRAGGEDSPGRTASSAPGIDAAQAAHRLHDVLAMVAIVPPGLAPSPFLTPPDHKEEPKPPVPDEKAAAPAVPDPKLMAAIATQMNVMVNGPIHVSPVELLKGRSAAEIALIRAEYAAQTGQLLDVAIATELNDKDKQVAMAALTGDKVNVALAELETSAGIMGAGTDSARIKKTLEGLTDPKDRERVARLYEEKTGTKLDIMLAVAVPGAEGRITRALAAGDTKLAATLQAEEDTKKAAFDQEKSKVDREKMGEKAAAIFKAVDGIGTKESAIYEALDKLSPAEAEVLKEIYADHFPGRTLQGDLEDDMSGTELDEALGKLSGDPVKAAVATLENAADGVGTAEKKIFDVLNSLKTPAQREEVARAYKEKYGRELTEMLDSEMSGRELEIATAYVEGDAIKASAVRLLDAAAGAGTDETEIFTVLEEASDDERKKIIAAYEKRTGEKLSDMLASEMGGAELDIGEALLKGNKAEAAAARLKNAADGVGTDEKTIYAQFEDKKPAERQAIIKAYNEKYGKEGMTFDQMIDDEMSGMDAERAKMLAEKGKLDDAFMLDCAMDGAGTDEEMIKKAVRGKTKAEIVMLRLAYTARTGKDLQEELDGELSGRDAFQVQQEMLGKPTTPEEKLARMEAAYQFERGQSITGASVTDLFSSSGEVLDMQHRRVQELGDRIRAGTATAEDLQRLDVLAGYHKQDVDNYQAAKDTVTDAAAMVGTAVVGTIVTIATAGAMGPATAAMLGALAGGASGMAIKSSMQGSAYGVDDMVIDSVLTLASVASAGIVQTKFLGDFARQTAARLGGGPLAEKLVAEAIKGAVSGGVQGLGDVATNEELWRNGDVAGALGKMGLTIVGSAVGNVASGGFEAGLAKMDVTGKNMDPRLFKGLVGGAGGIVGGGAQVALAPGTWEGNWEDIVGRFGLQAALGFVSNLMQGIAEGAKDMPHNAKAMDVDFHATPAPAKETTHVPEAHETKVTPKEVEAAKTAVATAPKELVEQAVVKNPALETVAPRPEAVAPAPAPVDPDRQALHEMALRARPEELATIREWARELDAAHPDRNVQALGELHRDARASDGMVDKHEGRTLDAWSREHGTDAMPFAKSMEAHGLDATEVAKVMEKMRGVDAAPGNDKAMHLDHRDQPMGDMTALSAREIEVWREAMIARFGDIHAGGQQPDWAGGHTIAPSPMRKIVDVEGAEKMAGGTRGQVGGFVGLASHSQGLTSTDALQMAGLDSDYHKRIGFFNPEGQTGKWTPQVAGPNGAIDMLDFPAAPHITPTLQLPLGDVPLQLMREEAARRLGQGAHIPALLEHQSVDPTTGLPHLPNIENMNRNAGDLQHNPYTAWGFTGTRRVGAGPNGEMLPIIPNQELKMKGYHDIPDGSLVKQVSSNGTESTHAQFADKKVERTAPTPREVAAALLRAFGVLRSQKDGPFTGYAE